MKRLGAVFLVLLVTTQVVAGAISPSGEGDRGQSRYRRPWLWDSDLDGVDDRIEAMPPDETIGVLVEYVDQPTELDAMALEELPGVEVKYVYDIIPYICARGVRARDAHHIAGLPGVGTVEWDEPLQGYLDVSARAIQSRDSDEYSPDTAADHNVFGEGISIAIMDSGVDDELHQGLDDLDDNTATDDPKFIAGVDFTRPIVITDGSYNPNDVDGHGSHCAGIALGTGSFGSQNTYMGVAPMARLVDVKVMENYGAGSMGENIAGIEWCVEHKDEFNIRVMSMSIGGRYSNDGTEASCLAVNVASEAGIVSVVAAGNDGSNVIPAPAAADTAIVVGSVGDKDTINRSDDSLSSFSNYGPRLDDGDDDQMDELKPDLVAPGEGIYSCQANTPGVYASQSGTSMSCPHVAGVVALMLDANPNLNPTQVREILRETAEHRGEASEPTLDPYYNYNYGWGIVNAYEAVLMAQTYAGYTSPPPVTLSVGPGTSKTTATVQWTPSDADGFASYDVYLSESASFIPGSQTLKAQIMDRNTTSYTFTGLGEDTTYYSLVRVTDDREFTSDSNVVSFKTLSQGDIIQVAITSPGEGARVRGTIEVRGTASSTEGLSRVEVRLRGYEWYIADGTEDWTVDIDLELYYPGNYTVEAKAIDEGGNTATDTVNITTLNTTRDSIFRIGDLELGPTELMAAGGLLLVLIILLAAIGAARGRRRRKELYQPQAPPAESREPTAVEVIVIQDERPGGPPNR